MKMRNVVTSATRRAIPRQVNKRVRYRREPLGFGGLTYRITLPPEK
jgi:hypothetical protein